MVLTFDVEILDQNPPPCRGVDYKTIGGIRFGSLNPNSLNLSDLHTVHSNRFHNKLNSFLKLDREIWCLQDVRFASKLQAFEKQVRVTRFGRYRVIQNSKNGQGGWRFL